MYQLSDSRGIRWRGPRAASSAEQRFEVYPSLGRHAAPLEKRRRRMGLKNGVAPRLRYMQSG